ncbi:MAG: hypothetical protein L6Q98_03835 [Anaerolineae bacterium]|nr:hypothetical protein [Anaerolineae bacterium]NUQ02275.1 hypothetical protein [Anaerolineae bacterium]
MPQRRRIVTLTIETVALLLIAAAVMLIAALRSDTLIVNYACGWFSCTGGLLPPLNDQFAIFEFIHHWAIIVSVITLPVFILLAALTVRRDDEAVMAGIRNTSLLIFLQALAALATTIVSLLWQGPALHFMVISMLLIVSIGVTAWAMFSPNQDYSPPLVLGALVVVSAIPAVAYIGVFI